MNSITLFHKGVPIIHKAIFKNQISIGTDSKNDLILATESIKEQQLVILKDNNGRWKSRQSDKEFTIERGKRISFGLFSVELGNIKANSSSIKHKTYDMGIIGNSILVNLLKSQIEKLSVLNAPVLIIGETGTGKELVAKGLHFCSSQNNAPFVAVNCGSLTSSMVEDIFFGHTKGSFTGAAKSHRGVFEQACGGTLFLDEIGELPLLQQSILLRVLDTKKINKIGSEKEISVDFRLVVATNRNLLQMVSEGLFRLDLYHRITTLKIITPTLRDRSGDIELLAKFFLQNMKKEVGKKALSNRALKTLTNHIWPGNVREFRNVLYRAAILCDKNIINDSNLEIEEPIMNSNSLQINFAHITENRMLNILKKHRGNVTAAARQLGIPRSTLRDRMNKIKLFTGTKCKEKNAKKYKKLRQG